MRTYIIRVHNFAHLMELIQLQKVNHTDYDLEHTEIEACNF